MVYRWMGYILRGRGGRSRTYKRQFTVFLIVIIEAIYTVEPPGPELQLAGSSYRAGRLCIIILTLMICYDS